MSKHDLLRTWPDPATVRDVAKFVGFGQFYSRFIPHFELLIQPLRTIMKEEYTAPIQPHWTSAAQDSWRLIKEAILADPCLQRYDHRRLTILRTDFSAAGFGYVVCQPGS